MVNGRSLCPFHMCARTRTHWNMMHTLSGHLLMSRIWVEPNRRHFCLLASVLVAACWLPASIYHICVRSHTANAIIIFQEPERSHTHTHALEQSHSALAPPTRPSPILFVFVFSLRFSSIMRCLQMTKWKRWGHREVDVFQGCKYPEACRDRQPRIPATALCLLTLHSTNKNSQNCLAVLWLFSENSFLFRFAHTHTQRVTS